MRTLRLTVVGTVMLALLGGLPAAVMAQSEADPMAPAAVTGTAQSYSLESPGTTSSCGDQTCIDGVRSANSWDASDTRLTGEVTYIGNWREYPGAGFQVEGATRVLENDGGRWVGTATALVRDGLNSDTIVLHGQDAYEGLTAYILMDWATEPATFVGAIFAGELPQFPEPPTD